MLDNIKNFFSLSDENGKNHAFPHNTKPPEYKNVKISNILVDNKNSMNKIFSNCTDLIVREVKITGNPQFTAMLVYIENMIDTPLIENSIITKMTKENNESSYYPGSREYIQYLLGISDTNIYANMNEVIDSILAGKLAIFIDGINEGIVLGLKSPPNRSIEEPVVETVIRGPREGFTESLGINRTLIRKIIKSTNLKTEAFTIGSETKTEIDIIYLSHISNPKIVAELRRRLNRTDIDSVLGSNYIKEYIEDEPLWGIPTIFSTERPEVLASKILEGRIAILVDGTPLAITVPALFDEFMTTSDDYFLSFIPATINRWVRYFALLLSLLLPGIYIAITTFHQELIPTGLMVTIIKARSKVPYSTLFECIMMLSVFEILREAGLRMPRAVGQAISVVGALVLGQAAVEAGLSSTPMVIVVALTALSSFALPSTDLLSVITLPRFIFIILGGSLGLIGVTCGLIILFMKLISVRSFGVPYMAPLAPIISTELPEILMRKPFWKKLKRSWIVTGRQSIKRKPRRPIK